METCIPGLYAAGEIVGGANGANRLSGNALPEAMVFGACAGERAGKSIKNRPIPSWPAHIGAPHLDIIRRVKERRKAKDQAPTHMLRELKEIMWKKVGAFRTADGLIEARKRIGAMRHTELDELEIPAETIHNTSLVEWFELRNGLQAAEAVALAGLNRRESRGAHQRLDFPETRDEYRINQRIWLADGEISSSFERCLS
jgi:succinate dehydrogenase/fumarate reductase flavoprotein subunit